MLNHTFQDKTAPAGNGFEPALLSSETPPALSSRAIGLLGPRIAAFLIDAVTFFVVFSVTSALITLLVERFSSLTWLLYPGFLAYKCLAEAIYGQTLGKKFLRIEVIRDTGEPAGYVAAFMRNIFLVPSAFFVFIPTVLMIEFSARRQRLGEIVANTVVVRKAPPSLPAPFVAAAPNQGVVFVRPSVSDEGDRRWLVASMLIQAVFWTLFLTLFTIQFTTAAHPESFDCYPWSRAPIWPHGDVGTVAVLAAGVLSVIVIPAAAGVLCRSWAWVILCPAMMFILSLPIMMVGGRLTERFYSAYQANDCGGSYMLAAAWFFLPVIAGIPTLIGTVIGRARYREQW
jgi:uncharacterized RDD family membrane protein YckC